MKKILYFLMAVAALAMFGCTGDSNLSAVVNPNGSALSPTGTIQGHLTDSCTGTPIANAVVDIGLGRATTSSTGQFVIYNVPATKQADSSVRGEYSATIDLRNAAAPDGTSLKGQYPAFTYRDMKVVFTTLNNSGSGADSKGQESSGIGQVVSGNNPAVPVIGLVSGDQDVRAGKKAATIKGTVLIPGVTPTPGAGYFVALVDWKGNVLGTTTSAQDGSFSFANVENGAHLTIKASKLDPSGSVDPTTDYNGSESVTAGCGTVVFENVSVSAPDNTPCLTGVDPVQYSNVTPAADGSVTVTFTFNKAIAANTNNGLLPSSATNDPINTLALTSAGNPSSLFAQTEVEFKGFKDSNVAFSLHWVDAKTLQVIIPNAAKGAIYSVDITHALSSSRYHWYKTAALTANDGEDGCGPEAKVTFYTFGAQQVVDKPTVQLIDTPYDYNSDVVLSWNPVTYAKGFNVYCQLVQNWGQTTQLGPWTLIDVLSPNTTANMDISRIEVGHWRQGLGIQDLTSTFIENGTIKITYNCYVKGVNADGLEGPASDTISGIADTVKPRATCYNTVATTLTVCYNEPMDKALVQTGANYAFENFSSSYVKPVISATGNYNLSNNCVTLTLDKAIDFNQLRDQPGRTQPFLAITGVTDVAGNGLNVDFSQLLYNAVCPF